MTAPANGAFAAAMLDELAAVIGALLETTPAVARATPARGMHWVATIEAEGLADACSVALDDAGAQALTARIMALPETPPREAVLETLREIVAKAVTAVALKPIAQDARLRVGEIAVGEWIAAPASVVSRSLEVSALPVPLLFAAWGQPAFPAAVQQAVAPPTRPDSPVKGVPQERIDVILDIDLPLVVRFGRTELPLKTLMRLGPGSVIDLGRSPDDPVEIVVSNRVIARGEVVVVAGNYGIRIVDVVSQTERIRSMEG